MPTSHSADPTPTATSTAPPPATVRAARAAALVLPVGTALALALILLDAWSPLLGDRLATQVGHNSEAFTLALALMAGYAWVRDRRRRGLALPVGVVVAAVVVLAVAGVALLAVDATRVRTLNEPVLAAAVLLAHAALPLPRRGAWLLAPAVLVLVVAFHGTDVVRLQAELLVALVLAPVATDLLCRWLVDPAAPVVRGTALAWAGLLLLVPVALMALKRVELGTLGDATVLYAARGNEAFWGLFLVVVHGLLLEAGRARASRDAAGGEPASASPAPASPISGI